MESGKEVYEYAEEVEPGVGLAEVMGMSPSSCLYLKQQGCIPVVEVGKFFYRDFVFRKPFDFINKKGEVE